MPVNTHPSLHDVNFDMFGGFGAQEVTEEADEAMAESSTPKSGTVQRSNSQVSIDALLDRNTQSYLDEEPGDAAAIAQSTA